MVDLNPSSPKRPWQPRFGIGTMLLFMVVISVTAAAGSYLVRSLRAEEGQGDVTRMVFVLFTLIAPVALVVLISGCYGIIRWSSRRRRK